MISYFLIYLLSLLMPLPNNEPDPKVSRGTLFVKQDFPSEFVTPRNIYIWVPENYDPRGAYPVLYMHDGQMLFDSTATWNQQAWDIDITVQQLIDEKKIPACIIVGIANTVDRYSEYFPQEAYQILNKEEQEDLMASLRYGEPMFHKPICSDDYLKFMIEELKPFIDEHYATAQGTENTFIAGSSMGGLISMYAFFEYPEVFGGAACLSTHWTGIFVQNDHIPNAFLSYMSTKKDLLHGRRLYFDHGTETLDTLYEVHQRKVDKLFHENSTVNDSCYMSRKFEGTGHTERAWKERFAIPLNFLIGNKTHQK